MAFVGLKTHLQLHRAINTSLVLPIDATPSAAGPVPPPQARSRGPTRGAATALRGRVGTPAELLLHPPPLFWTFHSISHRSCSCGPVVCAFRAIRRSHFSKPTSILVSYLLRLLPFFVPLSLSLSSACWWSNKTAWSSLIAVWGQGALLMAKNATRSK